MKVSNNVQSEEALYVSELIERARTAQNIIEEYTQEQIDELVARIAWAGVQKENAEKISRLAIDESNLGNFESKYSKLQKKIRGALRDIKNEKTVGLIEEIKEKGIKIIAKPVGVIGAIIPCTNPEATPFIKAMFAIKARNAILMSPHPRTKKTNKLIVDIMREVLKEYGAPEDLIITIEEPTIELSSEVMKQADLIIATGGSGMVKSAYSSGKPAYGVGVGNAVVVVDETADLNDAAHKVMLSKTFDFATSCSSENSLVIKDDVYDEFISLLVKEGGYLINADEKEKLKNAMWSDKGILNRKIVAQPAEVIAKEANIDIACDNTFFIVEESGVGRDYLFSGEKMSVVLTVFKYSTFAEAIAKVNMITDYMGSGHSCGIHSINNDHIMELSLKTKTSRVIVRQPQCYANSGNWENGMPFTLTLGCGTWGGNITSDNINIKHFYNKTWVSEPIKETIPSDEYLFGSIING